MLNLLFIESNIAAVVRKKSRITEWQLDEKKTETNDDCLLDEEKYIQRENNKNGRQSLSN